MRKVTGVVTCDHMAFCGEVGDLIFSGWRAARLAKRKRVFTRLRMLSTSRRTDLGQRCWGSVPIFGAPGFCGNTDVAVIIASPKMVLEVGDY